MAIGASICTKKTLYIVCNNLLDIDCNKFGALTLYHAIGEVSKEKTIAAKLVVAAVCNYLRRHIQM